MHLREGDKEDPRHEDQLMAHAWRNDINFIELAASDIGLELGAGIRIASVQQGRHGAGAATNFFDQTIPEKKALGRSLHLSRT